jgi:hypothetical protein
MEVPEMQRIIQDSWAKIRPIEVRQQSLLWLNFDWQPIIIIIMIMTLPRNFCPGCGS